MKKKIMVILVMSLIFVLIFSACDQINQVKDVVKQGSDIIEQGKSELGLGDGTSDTKKGEGFQSIDTFIVALSKMSVKLMAVSTSVGNPKVYADNIAISTVGASLINAKLEHTLKGMPDSWENGKGISQSDDSDYVSSLQSENENYLYTYTNTFNNGYVDIANLLYDVKGQTIQYSFTTSNDGKKNIKTQFYINKDNVLFISNAECTSNDKSAYILMYDGNVINYARVYDFKGDTPILPKDIINNPPSDWNDLIKGFDYSSIFTYNGSEAKYEVK